MRRMVFVLFTLCFLLLSSTGWSRNVEFWDYERLFEEADLVVIAAVRKTNPSDEAWSEALFSEDRFVGTETCFDVRSVLKGEASTPLRVIHFRYKSDAVRYEDGPGLVSFAAETKSQQEEEIISGLKGKSRTVKQIEVPRDYLLFLKKRVDGRYEAISGQLDAAFSVRAIFPVGYSR